MRWGIVLLGVAACGRFGFDAPSTAGGPDAGNAQGSGGSDVDAPVETAATCGSAVTLGTVSGMNHQIAVASSASGFIGVTTDSTTAVRAWGAVVAADGSMQSNGGVAISVASNGELGIAPTSTGAIVATTVAGNTYMQALDPTGAAQGAAFERPGDSAAEGPLAASGLDGAVALATVAGNGEIDARVIDATGGDAGAVVAVVDAAIGASEFQLAPAGTGYAGVWSDYTQTPAAKRVALYNADLSLAAGPVTASTSQQGAENGQVAWAKDSNRYLVVWQDKDDTGADEVNLRLFDGTLTPLAAQATLALTQTGGPKVSSDGTGFYVSARSYTPDQLTVLHVAPDGTVTTMPSLDDNGNAEVWAATERGTQTATAWIDGAVFVDVPCP